MNMATNEQDEIARLRAINEDLELDLSETQDRLFGLTEKENDVPEKAIKDAYLAIIRGVNFWIDEVSGHKDFSFRPKWQEHMQSQGRQESLKKLGFDARYHDITWQKKLGEAPSAHYTFLSLVITRILRREIFNRSETSSTRGAIYPFSLNDKSIKLVNELQQAMGSEELGKDESQILRWRGDTISAMVLQRKFKERLQAKINGILKDMAKDLEEWLDPRVLQDRKTSLRQYVIDPAVEFARLAGCARKKYILETQELRPGPVPSDSSWNIRDASNWRKIAPSEARGVFHCLWPMLVRKGTGGQPDNQLVQSTMIGFHNADDPEASGLSQSGASRELARSSKSRSDDTTSSRQSTSPTKKPTSARHGEPPADKEPSFLRRMLPGSSVSSSSSTSWDARPSRHASDGRTSTWPSAEPSGRRH